KRILKFYEQTAGLTENEILPLLRNETFLNNDEAYKLGFATEKSIQVEPVARFHKDNKQKPNKQMSKEKGILAKIKAIFSELPVTNKVVFDAEGKELDFYELEEGATIELGAKANVDGKPAEGEISVQSEEDPAILFTYVFE